MKHFPKMNLSRIQLFVIGIFFFSLNFIIFVGIGRGVLTEKQALFSCLLWNGSAIFWIVVYIGTINIRVKHNFWLMISMDSRGIACYYKTEQVWSCRWDEIHHLEKRTNPFRNRSLYIFLSAEEEKPFYFEYCLASKKALFAACTREDLLADARKPLYSFKISG